MESPVSENKALNDSLAVHWLTRPISNGMWLKTVSFYCSISNHTFNSFQHILEFIPVKKLHWVFNDGYGKCRTCWRGKMPCRVSLMQYLLPEQTVISLKVTYRASIRHGKHITPHLPILFLKKDWLPHGYQLLHSVLHLNKDGKHFYINCGIWVIGHGEISSPVESFRLFATNRFQDRPMKAIM